MKKHLLWIVPCIVAVLVSAVAWRLRAQNVPVRLDGNDLILYQRDKAEILLIQLQNKPLTDEFNAIASRWCSRASIPKDVCIIDDSGLVTRAPAAK